MYQVSYNFNFWGKFLLAVSLVFLTSCGGDAGTGTNNTPTQEVDSTRDALNVEFANSIPSPIQMAAALENAELIFNDELLNSPENVDRYTRSFNQAINLGVFEADLGYALINRQSQEAIAYFKGIKQLGDKLGIFGHKEDELLDRVEKNIENRDSLFQIFTEAYEHVDVYLNENRRPEIADLVAVGGWIEGGYIASQSLKSTNSEDIKKRIAEEKFVLPILIKMLETHESNPEIKELNVELKKLYREFRKIDVAHDYSPAVTDTNRKITRITSTKTMTYTDDQLKIITEKIAAIRNKYIQ